MIWWQTGVFRAFLALFSFFNNGDEILNGLDDFRGKICTIPHSLVRCSDWWVFEVFMKYCFVSKKGLFGILGLSNFFRFFFAFWQIIIGITKHQIKRKVAIETEDGTLQVNGVWTSGFCDDNVEAKNRIAEYKPVIEDYKFRHFGEEYNSICMDKVAWEIAYHRNNKLFG